MIKLALKPFLHLNAERANLIIGGIQMVRFKDVKVDPWLQKQEEYKEYKRIPEEAVFVCAYFVFVNPFDFVDAAFLRRTGEKDELWVGTWDHETNKRLADYSDQSQFESFGCMVVKPQSGGYFSAARILLAHLFRSRVGFVSPSDFLQGGLLAKSHYLEVINFLRNELRDYKDEARKNMTEIVYVAKELGLGPEPTGSGPYSWIARCPGTNHHIAISTESDSFGCGYCRRKGGPEELKAFVKERNLKKRGK